MRFAGAALLAILFCGCGSSREEMHVEEKAAKSEEPGKRNSSEVVLTVEAQKSVGITDREVRPESVSETIPATGQLMLNEDQTWMLGALVAGRVVSMSAKVGDRVNQGDVLARIHSHEVHDARAALKTAQTELERTESAEAYARRIRDRARRLLEVKAGSQQDLETAETQLRNAESAVLSAKVNVDKERTHIVEFLEVPTEEHLEIGHQEKGADPDDYVPVKAPASGLVIERKATPGTVVAAGNEIFRISSTASLWMIANVNESDLGRLRAGQSVRVFVRAFPERPFEGRILRLGEQLDPATRTLQVRVLVPNPGNVLKPEMYATAEIARAASREALFVPEEAAQDLNGARVVFVRTGADRFEVRPIQVSRARDQRLEVTAGLRSGDRVVVKGAFILKSQLLKSSLAGEE